MGPPVLLFIYWALFFVIYWKEARRELLLFSFHLYCPHVNLATYNL